jgi:Phage tail tube protein, GTA-gp10
MQANGESTIVLNGKEFVLRPGYKALARVETVLNERTGPLMQRVSEGNVGVRDVAIICHAMIAAGGAAPMPTIDDIGEWIIAAPEGWGAMMAAIIKPYAEALKATADVSGNAAAPAAKA